MVPAVGALPPLSVGLGGGARAPGAPRPAPGSYTYANMTAREHLHGRTSCARPGPFMRDQDRIR